MAYYAFRVNVWTSSSSSQPLLICGQSYKSRVRPLFLDVAAGGQDARQDKLASAKNLYVVILHKVFIQSLLYYQTITSSLQIQKIINIQNVIILMTKTEEHRKSDLFE